MRFIQPSSHPLDYLLWEHSRGLDRRDAVLGVLAAYQNADGGFTWALEPDYFTEASTPTGARKATTALRQIGCFDRTEPLVGRTIDYLLATRRADGRWDSTPAPNRSPTAPTREHRGPEERVEELSPAAALLGYLLRAGVDVRKEIKVTIEAYVAGGPVSRTELPCLMTLYEDLTADGVDHPRGFRARIAHDLAALVGADASAWNGRPSRPALLFGGGHEEFLAG